MTRTRVPHVLGLLLVLLTAAGYTGALPSPGDTAVVAVVAAEYGTETTGTEYDLTDEALRPALRVAPRPVPAARVPGVTVPPPGRPVLLRVPPAASVPRSVVLRC